MQVARSIPIADVINTITFIAEPAPSERTPPRFEQFATLATDILLHLIAVHAAGDQPECEHHHQHHSE
ncbi:MAG: hypothetical protein SH809_12090 [Rhodothermales bacterium]|nr:hypothetical protein [Rhodothermales bacterium]